MAQGKKVSIIIPVYNGSNFLGEAIDSALAQTYKNTEVVVINDGSNDDGATEQIALSYGDRIRYYAKPNGGVASALNYGIEKMRGDYFSWLSHDDLYEKTKVEDQVRFLAKFDPRKTIAACGVKVLFDSGVRTKEKIDKKLFSYFDVFLSISGDVGVNGCSLLIPRAALIEAGGFNINLPVTQDYDLWFRLFKNGMSFELLEKSLVVSRRHEGQDSVKKIQLCMEAGDKLHHDFLSDIGISRFTDFMKDGGERKVLQEYQIYKNAGFHRTSSMILRNILHYYIKIDKVAYSNFLASEIGMVQYGKRQGEVVGKGLKTVLIYTNVWRTGGVERVLSRLMKLFSADYNLIFAINHDGMSEQEGFSLPERATIVKINNNNIINELLNVVMFFDADVFIGNPNFDLAFLDIYQKLEGTRVKTVAYNHTHFMLPYMKERLLPVALKQEEAFAAADAVAWISRVAGRAYATQADNGVIIPNFFESSDRAPLEPGSRKRVGKRILAVGRFGEDEIKRIDRIIKVFSEVVKRDPEYTLDIVGYCNLDIPLIHENNVRLGDFIELLKIPQGSVTIHGNQKDVIKFYDQSDILLLTSDLEGFALVLVEAMSRGLPCACFDYIGLNEIVQDGVNGVVADQDSYGELADKIVLLVSGKGYAGASKAAMKSSKQYSDRLFSERWTELMEELTSDAPVISRLSFAGDKLLNDDDALIRGYMNALDAAIGRYLILKQQLEQKPGREVLYGNRLSSGIDRLHRSVRAHGYWYTSKVFVKKTLNKFVYLVKN